MTSYSETQYKVAIVGPVSIILGAIIGGYFTYFAAHQVYQEQQSNELKNIAKAMDINFETFNAAYVSEYSTILNNSTNENYTPLPDRPLYTQNDPYFVFDRDISKFDHDLSSNIYEFYSNLFKAEEDRLYILQYQNSTDPETQKNCIISYIDMRTRIDKCAEDLPEIKRQLKEIYQN